MIKIFFKISLVSLGTCFSIYSMDPPTPEFDQTILCTQIQNLQIEIRHHIFSNFNSMINYFNFSEQPTFHDNIENMKTSLKGISKNYHPSSRTELGIIKLLNNSFFQNFPLTLMLDNLKCRHSLSTKFTQNFIKIPNLTGLTLGKNHIKIRHLQLLTNLQTLDVKNYPLFRLGGIKMLTNLTSLQIGSINSEDREGEINSLLKSTMSMEAQGKLYKDHWPFYSNLYCLTNLTRLDLNKDTRTPFGENLHNSFPYRRELLKIRQRHPNLNIYYEGAIMKKHIFQPTISSNGPVFLEDWRWEYTVPRGGAEELISLPNLTHLILYECVLKAKYLKLLTNLKILDIIDSQNIENKTISNLTNLTTLHMRPYYKGIKYKTLKKLTNLTYLNIVGARGTSQSYLCRSDYFEDFRCLDQKILKKLPSRLPNITIALNFCPIRE